MQGVGCGGVAADESSDTARHGWGDLGGPPPAGEAQTYRVAFSKDLVRLWCLLEGCLVGASNQTNLRVQFAHRHEWDTIVILEEGNQPYPRCPQCDKSDNGFMQTWNGEEA